MSYAYQIVRVVSGPFCYFFCKKKLSDVSMNNKLTLFYFIPLKTNSKALRCDSQGSYCSIALGQI
jgi:hypothetical protein